MKTFGLLASALCLFAWLEPASTGGVHVGKMGADKIKIPVMEALLPKT